MEAGTVPPHWGDLVEYSSEKSTTNDVNLADTWLSGNPVMGEKDQLSDPFTVVTDHHKSLKQTKRIHGKPATPSANIAAADTHDRGPQTRAGQERNHSPLTQSDQVNQAAANSFGNTGKQSTQGI